MTLVGIYHISLCHLVKFFVLLANLNEGQQYFYEDLCFLPFTFKIRYFLTGLKPLFPCISSFQDTMSAAGEKWVVAIMYVLYMVYH